MMKSSSCNLHCIYSKDQKKCCHSCINMDQLESFNCCRTMDIISCRQISQKGLLMICSVQWHKQVLPSFKLICMCTWGELSSRVYSSIIHRSNLWHYSVELWLSFAFGVCGWNVKEHHVYLEYYSTSSSKTNVTFSSSRTMPTNMMPMLFNMLYKMFTTSLAITFVSFPLNIYDRMKPDLFS